MAESKELKDKILLKSQSLKELYELYESSPSLIKDVQTKFYGWIRRSRSGGAGTLCFIDVYDGTCVGDLKCVVTKDRYLGDVYESKIGYFEKEDELDGASEFKTLSYDQLLDAKFLSDGCSVVCDGVLRLTEGSATQPFELDTMRIRVIGGVEDAITYPIQKTTEKSLVSLRGLPFMRIRAQAMQSIFRITSKLEFEIHKFMDSHDVVKTDSNIFCTNDAEGAGETFTVSPHIFSTDSEGKPIPVSLTVSSQLPLESSICGFKRVYTSQKSFRAEKSSTNKHLAEFLHIEYEEAFTTLDKLMDFTELLLKTVIRNTIIRCKDDFDFLESKFAPNDIRRSREMLSELIDIPFIRIKHRDAIDLIQKIVKEKMSLPTDDGKMQRVKLDKLPKQGEDIGSEHEKLLCRYFGYIRYTEEEREKRLKEGKPFEAFVYLTHWPLGVKSFYMKQCDDGSGESESFDLLATSRVGELIGASSREYRYDKLVSEITRRDMNVASLQWFIDLRKNGTVPHAGFGLGFSRLAMLLTGVSNIRDVVYLPVAYLECKY
jgi:asparaginyl-tRNA synthetase